MRQEKRFPRCFSCLKDIVSVGHCSVCDLPNEIACDCDSESINHFNCRETFLDKRNP